MDGLGEWQGTDPVTGFHLVEDAGRADAESRRSGR